MDLATFQLVCLPILALAYLVHLVWGTRPEARAKELGIIAFLFVCAWGAEETAILRYQMYAYPDAWWGKLDEMPLLVAAIWPMVILSSRAVIRALFPTSRGWHLALFVGLAVVWDASLVEVIATDGGLWKWRESGYFGVPPIGILGWGCFAASATFALEWALEWEAEKSTWVDVVSKAAAPAIAIGGTHVLLVVLWWLAFKWIGRTLWPELSVIGFAAVGMVLVVVLWRRRERVPLTVAGPRILAALAFLVQLVARGSQASIGIWVHVGAVAAPYLATLDWTGARAPAKLPKP